MDYNLILFLPAVIIFGLLTSYTDIKYSKIRNRHIVIAIIYTLVVYLFLISFFLIKGTNISVNYIVELITNPVISLVLGFLMWGAGLWTAGDSKLFFAYSLLVPISFYHYTYVPYFPAIILMVNTFVPIFFVIFFMLMIKTTARQKINTLKGTIQPSNVINTALSLFALWWVIRAILYFLGNFNELFITLANNYIFMISAVFIIMITTEKIIKKPFLVLFLLTLIRIFLDKSIYSISFVYNFSFLIAFFLFVRFFIIELVFIAYTKQVDIILLKEGMIPAEVIYFEKGAYRKERISSDITGYSTGNKRGQMFQYSPDGLSEKDINKIKNLDRKGKLKFEHLLVYNQLPFAPFLFFGALATIIAKGNLFSFLLSFLK